MHASSNAVMKPVWWRLSWLALNSCLLHHLRCSYIISSISTFAYNQWWRLVDLCLVRLIKVHPQMAQHRCGNTEKLFVWVISSCLPCLDCVCVVKVRCWSLTLPTSSDYLSHALSCLLVQLYEFSDGMARRITPRYHLIHSVLSGLSLAFQLCGF